MGTVAVLTTEADYHAFVAGKPVAVVEFWAEWCAPCKKVTPVLERIAAANPGLPFAKIDADQVTDLARKLGVFSLPTTLVFKHGQPADHITGAYPQASFEAKIKSSI